ncbi:MAG: hypothetical protein KDA53_10370 [Hyphomonas sp.]|nr:hypothetical protein [Hyphomonas sp.]
MTARKKSEGTPPDGPSSSVSLIGADAARIVLTDIAELKTEVRALTKSVESLSEQVGKLNTKAIQIDTALKVGGTLIVLFFGLFWWMFGKHVDAAVQNALREVVLQQDQKSDPS